MCFIIPKPIIMSTILQFFQVYMIFVFTTEYTKTPYILCYFSIHQLQDKYCCLPYNHITSAQFLNRILSRSKGDIRSPKYMQS